VVRSSSTDSRPQNPARGLISPRKAVIELLKGVVP
jgi:hypothetical protein